MRRIRETLRLHLQAGLSYNEVGRALKISKSAAGKYVSLARMAGVDWALAQTLTDEELEARLYRPALPRSSHQLAPDFALVHQELKRAGVTLQLLWEEYARGNALAYKYTSFCVKYRVFAQSLKLSMRQVHIGGEKLFVDYAGQTVPLINAITGEIIRHDARAKALTKLDTERNIILTCCAYAVQGPIALELGEDQCAAGESPVPVPARVVSLDRVAPDVMVVRVALPKRRPMPYKAGQFVLVDFEDGRLRAFSLGRADSGDGQIELHIGRIPGGAFTAHVFDGLKVGDVLRIAGPYGDFCFTSEEKQPLFVAGGTGIAPVLAILEEIVSSSRPVRAVYWGCRAEDGFYAEERLTSLSREGTDRFAKTIVFCEDIDHASRMRQALSNANADISKDHPKYVVQITGDNPEGKLELDNFIDPEKTYPVIATTSKLMSTGVDAQTCKLIVLDQNIKSMTLFKQIIGRGTRLREDLGKTWFTILDFKRATDIFADKNFDGDPVQIYEPKGDEPVDPPEPPADPPPEAGGGGPGGFPDGGITTGPGEGGGVEVKRYVVGGIVTVAVARERVQYLNAQGKLITESLRDYTRINLTRQYDSLDKFLQAWSDAERKAVLLQELESQGVLLDALADEVGKDLDPFDLLLHVAWNMPLLTRRERANRVKKRNVFTQYGPVARQVIEALIDKYADEGVQTIESMEVLNVPPLTGLGSPVELVRSFGGRAQYLQALQLLEQELYAPQGLLS